MPKARRSRGLLAEPAVQVRLLLAMLEPAVLSAGITLAGGCGRGGAPPATTTPAPASLEAAARARPLGHAPSTKAARASLETSDHGRVMLPRHAKRVRWLVAPAAVRLWTGQGQPVALHARVAQVGPIRWPERGLPLVPCELILRDGSWVRGRCGARDLEIPVPRGTPLRAEPADPEPVGLALAPLRVQPILTRDRQVLVRVRIRQGCGAQVRLWVSREALAATAGARPVPPSFARPPAGPGLDVSCVTRALTLQAQPEARPLLALPLCSVLGYSLHRIQTMRSRHTRWARVRYRPGPHSPLVLLGVVPDQVLRRAVRQGCACQCLKKSPSQPVETPPRPVQLTRDLPLYRRPYPRTSPVGMLRRGFRLEPVERLTGSRAAWTRIYLSGQAFYLPHVPGALAPVSPPR